MESNNTHTYLSKLHTFVNINVYKGKKKEKDTSYLLKNITVVVSRKMEAIIEEKKNISTLKRD